jgi:hypothetical protein
MRASIDLNVARLYARKQAAFNHERLESIAVNSGIAVICGLVLALSVTAQPGGMSHSGGVVTSREPTRSRNHQPRIVPTHLGPASTLRIKNVRLESAPPSAANPSALLKFDMVNEGSLRLTDVLLEIALVERKLPDTEGAPRVIVGPFTIRGNVTIDSGYTVNYEMLLRNFSVDCGCVANVFVLSARAMADSGS